MYKIIIDGFNYKVLADFAWLILEKDKLFLLLADIARFLLYI